LNETFFILQATILDKDCSRESQSRRTNMECSRHISLL
jgi:hypothetical protein